MEKFTKGGALKRQITIHIKNEAGKDTPVNAYPAYGLRKMIEDLAADNMESVSKTCSRIIRNYFRENPNRKRATIE